MEGVPSLPCHVSNALELFLARWGWLFSALNHQFPEVFLFCSVLWGIIPSGIFGNLSLAEETHSPGGWSLSRMALEATLIIPLSSPVNMILIVDNIISTKVYRIWFPKIHQYIGQIEGVFEKWSHFFILKFLISVLVRATVTKPISPCQTGTSQSGNNIRCHPLRCYREVF